MTPERPRGSEKFKMKKRYTKRTAQSVCVCVTDGCNFITTSIFCTNDTVQKMAVYKHRSQVCVDCYFLVFTQWRRKKGLKHLLWTEPFISKAARETL